MSPGPTGDPILDALDPQQRVAAETLDGPVAILAGAGTGKTRTITHRIAYGVSTGRFVESRTMALTFTTRAAGELRSRFRALGVGQVQARTFHAAALSQLGFFWPQVIGGTMPRIVEGKAVIIAEAAEALGLRPDAALIRDVAAEIEWRKVSDLSVDEWAASGRQVDRLRIDQVVALQRAYEDHKDERRVMDLEDVLLATAGMLAAEAGVARSVRDQYRSFVVDEYQDVSPIQHRLLRLWLGDRRDLCVVGDANQTIYTFAGASAQFLLGFEREFTGAAVVRLEHSHRSTQPILDLANRLMVGRAGALRLVATDPDPLASAPVPPAPGRKVSGEVLDFVESEQRVAHFSGTETETETGTEAGTGTGTGTEQGAGYEGTRPGTGTARANAGPSARGSGGPSRGAAPVFGFPTDRAELDGLVAAIRADLAAGVEPSRVAVLVRVNAQTPAIEAAIRAAGLTVQIRGDARFYEQPHVREAIVHLVAARRTTPAEAPAGPTVRAVLAGLGWTPETPREGTPLAARERWIALDALHGLAADSPGIGFARFIDELLERQAANDDPVSGSVVIATIHSAKGLEWDSVHLVGLVEGLLPISYATDEAGVEEERRLLYVAITRARRRLRLSWSKRATPSAPERTPSRFLADL